MWQHWDSDPRTRLSDHGLCYPWLLSSPVTYPAVPEAGCGGCPRLSCHRDPRSCLLRTLNLAWRIGTGGGIGVRYTNIFRSKGVFSSPKVLERWFSCSKGREWGWRDSRGDWQRHLKVREKIDLPWERAFGFPES